MCIYCRNFLPLELLNVYYLHENISFKLHVGSKIGKSFFLYWSPSKTSDGFKKFTDNSELTLDTIAESNSHLIIVLGDFNIKSKNLYINDKTTTEGAKIGFATSQCGFHQIINEPTYFREFLVLY